MNKRTSFLNLWTFLSAAASACAQIYVSPSGDDNNPGSSDKPVAHLSRAVELSRSLPEGQKRQVLLTAGVYYDTGVTLTPKDSNLTIESSDGQTATLVGGVPLTGWTQDGDRFWSAPLPTGKPWDVRLLQVNGRFCDRARFPEKDTLTHLSVFDVRWMSTTGGGWKRPPTNDELTTLKYKEGDIPAGLDTKSAEVTVFHMWDESVAGVSANDTATKTLKLAPPLGHPPGAFDVKKYCIWNTKEGMTRPGQWYFDRSRNCIVYCPLPAEEMSKAAVVVPTRRVVCDIKGATNVTLRNFNVSVTTVPLVMGGFAAANFDGAVQVSGSSGTTLSNLRISNVAGQGVKVANDQPSIRVEDCDIAFCGAGGIYLNGNNNVAHNNLIHDVGLMFPSAMGINGGGNNSVLSHNEIYNTTYSAIGFGGENAVMEYNLIHHCMKVLHDGAAIYTFGSKHAILRGNFAHDIEDFGGYGASSYYLDETCEDCVVENNISINVVRASHNHMATNNIVRNNVFINSGDLTITFPRCTRYTIQGNVLYAGGKITFEGVNNVAAWSKNIVYSGAGKVDGVLLKDYESTNHVSGVREDTLVADPLFVDVSKLDLRYKEQSPALKLNLQPLDVSKAGRVKNVRKTSN